eukprot:1596201-Heterocapsa_arctica.AAC.1
MLQTNEVLSSAVSRASSPLVVAQLLADAARVAFYGWDLPTIVSSQTIGSSSSGSARTRPSSP